MLEPEDLGNQTQETPEPAPEQPAPFVPAPVSRRIWAWMGIVYVLLAMGLVTYWIATTTFLSGITGIMLFPLLGALSAQGFNNALLCRRGRRPGNFALLTASAGLMGLLALAVLGLGVVQLLGAWGV